MVYKQNMAVLVDKFNLSILKKKTYRWTYQEDNQHLGHPSCKHWIPCNMEKMLDQIPNIVVKFKKAMLSWKHTVIIDNYYIKEVEHDCP